MKLFGTFTCDSTQTIQGYYRKVEALCGLGRYEDALQIIQEGNRLDKELFSEIEDKIRKQISLDNYFKFFTNSKNIQVKFVSKTKGKGLFYCGKSQAEKGDVLFTEVPKWAIQKVDNKVTIKIPSVIQSTHFSL